MKGHFLRIAETAHRASSTEAVYSEHSIAIHSISMAGYVNAVPAFVCFELPTREASSFGDFWKLTSCDDRIYLLFDWSKLLFLSMRLLRINLPNLCPNVIHVDALDFSEWHSKEVISFFWRSVYISINLINLSIHKHPSKKVTQHDFNWLLYNLFIKNGFTFIMLGIIWKSVYLSFH